MGLKWCVKEEHDGMKALHSFPWSNPLSCILEQHSIVRSSLFHNPQNVHWSEYRNPSKRLARFHSTDETTGTAYIPNSPLSQQPRLLESKCLPPEKQKDASSFMFQDHVSIIPHLLNSSKSLAHLRNMPIFPLHTLKSPHKKTRKKTPTTA
mmetsp:Transcript_5305/g.19840  ORF Transcript_5305/g.19840 Transcript_5305/m.19840 type:complete len:151 (+) Transcript_5305:1459-1911(+)